MALAFKYGVIAGRQSYLAGRIEKSIYGSASSPKTGIIQAAGFLKNFFLKKGFFL